MKLYVGNLSKDLTDEQFKALAVPYGSVTSANVARDRAGESKGFGFIEFATATEANAAITGLNGTELSGQHLKVSEARSQQGSGFPRGRSY